MRIIALAVGLVLGACTTAAAGQGATPPQTGQLRTYFIAVDEVLWDYAPEGINEITGRPFDDVANTWMKPGPDRIGRVYKKAIYREYTDATFKTLKPRGERWEHLGMIGPLIRAEVGDTIKVVFRNNATHPFSMHPHGVFYDKASEGALYSDGTSGGDRADDGVPPNGAHTYKWDVPERCGPSDMEGSTALWMYHSHTDESRDVNSGLVGPMVITRRGMAHPDATPTDVDRELVATFGEIDENLSWYIDENIKAYAEKPETVRKATGPTFVDPFGNSNLMETINGFVYGNGPMMTMVKGERVRWYILSTTNFELHAPHWHGNVVTAQHMRTDVITLGTMGMVVADMLVDNPGVWLFHCHIEPHLTAGMSTRYRVLEAPPKTSSR